MRFFNAIDRFMDSLYHSWESVPALFLFGATVFLIVSIGNLTGWPPENTWDQKLREEHEHSRGELGWAVWLFAMTVVGTLVLAWLFSISPMGNHDSFVAELVMIVQHVFGIFAVLLVIIALVAGAVRFMVNHS